MSEFGWNYNVIQTNGEGWHVLTVMNEYRDSYGYETIGTFVDKKTKVLCVMMRKARTEYEKREDDMKHAIEQERRDKKARYK